MNAHMGPKSKQTMPTNSELLAVGCPEFPGVIRAEQELVKSTTGEKNGAVVK